MKKGSLALLGMGNLGDQETARCLFEILFPQKLFAHTSGVLLETALRKSFLQKET